MADGVDLALDAVGAEGTQAAALRVGSRGGVIVHVGLMPGATGFDIRRITLQILLLYSRRFCGHTGGDGNGSTGGAGLVQAASSIW